LRLLLAVAQHFGVADAVVGVVALAERQIAGGEEVLQFVHQLQLVLDRQFDVDALDAVGVFAHAVQRDHHVFVDLEGVGVLGDGGGARGPARISCALRADGNEAFAHAGIGQRTTSEAACATAFSSSPTMSPISTILGSTPRFDLVA
jgi:hypothetical protein